jgi:hypothetical protein
MRPQPKHKIYKATAAAGGGFFLSRPRQLGRFHHVISSDKVVGTHGPKLNLSPGSDASWLQSGDDEAVKRAAVVYHIRAAVKRRCCLSRY